ncbi:MAG: 4Fe-4S dicluster domain-containing protein [Rhodospirillaceae bacterium]|nr:4Fe-4S dicluster domain-containing protein [Rhodospirillaceae bacterium]
MSTRKLPVWAPPPEIQALFPEISGNTVNGLGEIAPRPPRYVMWTRPDRIAHGRVQQHVNDTYEAHPKLAGAFSGPERRVPPAPIAAERQTDTPENWTRRVKEFALAHEADLVGVARLDPLWVFEGMKAHLPTVVVLGVAMDHAELSKAPEPESPAEVARQYNRGTRAAKALANFIRGQGYDAEGHGGPGAGPLQLVPAAIAAGFGQLGKHGSIINGTLGSSFRLAGVLTDLPLLPDAPVDIGAEDFCASCQVCSNACPPAAIADTKQWVRGAEKWYVDFDKCMPYFASTWGCGICIAACPWSKPGTAPRLAEKMLKRRAVKA